MSRQFLKLLATVLVVFASDFTSAASCRRVDSQCVDSTPVKNVSGLNVTLEDVGGCWEYQDSYECVAETQIDYCSAISSTPGCSLIDTKCSAVAFNGDCALTHETYRCGASVAVTDNVIQLDDSHTIIYDDIDTTPCESNASNPSCQFASKVCTAGPETRVINGLEVFKDCWEWREDYNCIVSNQIDYCTPLKAAGCTELSSVCTNTAFTGSCIERSFEYVCATDFQPPPTNVVHLDTTYTLNDRFIAPDCESMENTPGCKVADEVCVVGPETRIVDGHQVYRDCWQWDKSYVCSTETPLSNCAELTNNPLCSKVDTACIESANDGGCLIYEHQYRCSESEPTSITELDCGSQSFCVGGECFDAGYAPDRDFQLAVSMKEMMREAGSYKIFQGEAGFCEEKLWGVGNCCKSKGGGQAGKNSNMVSKMGVAGAIYAGERVLELGSAYMYDALFEYSASATYAFMGEAAASALEQGLLSASMPSATLSMYGISWSSSAGLAGQGLMGANQALGASPIGGGYLYFNPYMMVVSVVTQVIMNYLECSEDEQILAMKRGQKLCYRVGSWCSNKILGSCETKKQGWCCFPSVLGRIVNEQGRAQLGKGWGSAKSPNCAGFTEDELQLLRFDEMDLSEFLSHVTANIKGSDIAAKRLEERVIQDPKSYYELK